MKFAAFVLILILATVTSPAYARGGFHFGGGHRGGGSALGVFAIGAALGAAISQSRPYVQPGQNIRYVRVIDADTGQVLDYEAVPLYSRYGDRYVTRRPPVQYRQPPRQYFRPHGEEPAELPPPATAPVCPY